MASVGWNWGFSVQRWERPKRKRAIGPAAVGFDRPADWREALVGGIAQPSERAEIKHPVAVVLEMR